MKSSLGIIGNVGVDGTAEFLKEVIKELDHQKVGTLPRIIVEGVEVNRADERLLLVHETTHPFKKPLQNSAQRLAEAGADIVVLACNTLHALQAEIRSALSGKQCEFFSLTDAVSAHLAEQAIQRVGIVGTSVTTGLFENTLRQKNIQQVLPEETIQKQLNESIRRIVTSEARSDEWRHTQDAIENIREKGADAFLIACTDLSQLSINSSGILQFDSTPILAKGAVRRLMEIDTN